MQKCKDSIKACFRNVKIHGISFTYSVTRIYYSKTCLKRPLKKKTKIGFQNGLSLNAGQKYCRMLQGEHSAILSTFIKLPFAMKTFVLSIFERPLKTGFTVPFSYPVPFSFLVFSFLVFSSCILGFSSLLLFHSVSHHLVLSSPVYFPGCVLLSQVFHYLVWFS